MTLKDIAYKLCIATEDAAISAFSSSGGGNANFSDQLACNALRSALNKIDINGTILIGEGERDDAPMLFIGEKVGKGIGMELDIAIDPLEGTSLCSQFRDGAMSALVIAHSGSIKLMPDVYMKKIVIGPNLPIGIVSLSDQITKNINNLALAKNCETNKLKIMILKRDRHAILIQDALSTGAKVKLIDDGDIGAVLAVMDGDCDMYVGIGGAPEGVISSVIAKNLGGQMQCKLSPDQNRKKHFKLDTEYNGTDYETVYTQDNMVTGNAIFIATGVTNSDFMAGVQISNNTIKTETLMISSMERKLIQTTRLINKMT